MIRHHTHYFPMLMKKGKSGLPWVVGLRGLQSMCVCTCVRCTSVFLHFFFLKLNVHSFIIYLWCSYYYFFLIRLTSAYTIGSHFYKNTPGVCVHWTQTRSDRYRPSQWGAPLGKSQLACFLLHVSKVSFSPQGIYYFSNFK